MSGIADTGRDRARIVFLIRVPHDRQNAFLAAYERIRHVVAAGTPGHLVDQVCQSPDDPEQWLITSEWRDLESFLAWERTDEHRALVRPMRECITEARSLRFDIVTETRNGAPTAVPGTGENSQKLHDHRGSGVC